MITARSSPAVTTRVAHFDTWVRQFLAAHPKATVLHLGCGLDSRYLRLNPGPDVEWYDVDFPEVIELRRQLYPEREHCHLIGSSITELSYLDDIPADRPTLMIAEGVTPYLTAADGFPLLRRVVDQFPSGELQFDGFSRFGILTQWTNAVVRRAGATLHWAIDGPDDIIEGVPGTRLLACVSALRSGTFTAIPRPYRLVGKVMAAMPVVRRMAQYHRYAFGSPD
jgi:O-methyltransferase involved in polyketide biosynthesis